MHHIRQKKCWPVIKVNVAVFQMSNFEITLPKVSQPSRWLEKCFPKISEKFSKNVSNNPL